MQEFLEIGQIVNTFGIKGMVKIKPFTDDIHKDMVLMKLKGIDKVEEAELLKNFYLEVKREDEPELEDDTYYIVDLLRTRSLF